jgi:hypothetical protein
MSILDILKNEQYQNFLPGLRLAAVADPGPTAGREFLQGLGVPVYASFQEMLAARPEIDLVVELVGSRFKLKAIRSTLPDHVSLIDHNAAFFCAACTTCSRSAPTARSTWTSTRPF